MPPEQVVCESSRHSSPNTARVMPVVAVSGLIHVPTSLTVPTAHRPAWASLPDARYNAADRTTSEKVLPNNRLLPCECFIEVLPNWLSAPASDPIRATDTRFRQKRSV